MKDSTYYKSWAVQLTLAAEESTDAATRNRLLEVAAYYRLLGNALLLGELELQLGMTQSGPSRGGVKPTTGGDEQASLASLA